MDYEGIITLTKNSRDRLAEQIGIKETAMRNQITRLCQKGIFRRIGTGEFEANPNLFARSAWSDIHKRRKCFKLTINYKNKKRILKWFSIKRLKAVLATKVLTIANIFLKFIKKCLLNHWQNNSSTANLVLSAKTYGS